MRSSPQVVPKCGDQLEHWSDVGTQRRLVGDPGFGMREGFEDPAAISGRSFHDALVDQKEEDRGRVPEGDTRPVFRSRKIVLQRKSHKANRLFVHRIKVFVVAVGPVMGQSAGPRRA